MKALKIIHVSAWGRTFTQFRMPLLRKLREIGAKQIIYCPNEIEHVSKLIEEGFEVTIGDVSSNFQVSIIRQILALYKFIKKENFSVLIAHQPMGALVGIPAAYFAGIPVKIYSTGGLKFSTDYKGFMNKLFKFGEIKIIGMSDAVFLVNREDEQLLKQNSSVKKKAYYVGPKGGCGVDINCFNPQKRLDLRNRARKEIGIADNIFLTGYIGRCVWEKGFKEIIDSAVLLKEKKSKFKIKYLILGKGHHLEDIEKYADERGVKDSFIFLGYKFNVNFYMSAMDVFILPSYREGLPISLLEAMAFGIPSIATNIRGNRELIINRKTGILVPIKDSSKLAEAILFLKNNPFIASTMGRKGHEDISKKFYEDILIDKTMNIIKQLTNEIGES
ncbi:glycosyltransferase [Desulfobacterales bacterium HSG17]|nr:glycosyltransferase [Desulfobacterales bacterium HSG17]